MEFTKAKVKVVKFDNDDVIMCGPSTCPNDQTKSANPGCQGMTKGHGNNNA